MKLPISVVAGLLVLNLGVSKAHAANQVGKDLLTYFSATCPSQGASSQLVISDAEAMIGVLENLKSDPDCVSAAGSIAQLGGLAKKVAAVEAGNAKKVEFEKLKAREFELTNQLGQVTDSAVMSELQSAIRSIQVEKAVLLAETNSQKNFQGESATETYSQIVLSTNQVFKSISNNQKCLDQNPRVLSTITSLISSIGGALSGVNPALGIGLSAGSEFIGNTVESIRIGRINNRIKKISQGTLVNSAFKCALESLSNRWCELGDAKKLLDFKFGLVKDRNQSSELLSVVAMYDRKIPSFLNWLSKVRAGAPAATEADAARHAVAYERSKIVQVASSRGDGILTEFKSRYDDPSTVTNQEKYGIIKQVISKLTGQCISGSVSYGDGVPNPLFDIYNSYYAPFRLLGLDKIPRDGSFDVDFCRFDPFSQWPSGVYSPDYSLVMREYSEWITKATLLANREFTQVLQPDALGVLNAANERTGSKWKASPKQSVDELIVFLDKNRPVNFETSAFRLIYIDTTNRLKVISDTLDKALIFNSISAKSAVETIFNTAELQFGNVVFSSRLEMIVRISLDEYFKQTSNSDQNIAAQMMAMESYLETLRKVYGKDDDELVMDSVVHSQKGAMDNMTKFVEVFAKNINELLQYNHKLIQFEQDKSQRVVQESNQAKLCNLLSSMPNIHKKVDISVCYGKNLKPFIKGGPETVRITEEYMQKDFDIRNCSYRDFLRKSKIYREWDIKL